MILDRETLKQEKTHYGRGLITDMDVDREQISRLARNPLNAEMTSKYGSRVLLATCTAILLTATGSKGRYGVVCR